MIKINNGYLIENSEKSHFFKPAVIYIGSKFVLLYHQLLQLGTKMEIFIVKWSANI